VSRTWTGFLRGVPEPAHGVELYADLDDLAESVAGFLAAGFYDNEPAVVVARPEHLVRFEEALAASGWTRAEIDARGLLVVADAEATLDGLLDGGRPSPEAFERVVGGLLDLADALAPGRRVRVFGEMVDVLSERGSPEAAVALEELWNELARKRRFTLLCGYRLDPFDLAAQTGLLPRICRAHSHVRPAHDHERFSRAVDQALTEVLGRTQAGRVYYLVDAGHDERVPASQLALMWVGANMPVLAERVFAAARTHYAAPEGVSSF
jgi:hypothetical protein